MNKSMNRLLSLFLVVCLTLSLFTGVFATTEATPEVTAITEKTATLVTNTAALKAGDQIIIAALNSDVALGTTQNTNNRAQASVTKSGSSLSFGDEVQVLTLEAGNVSGTFALKVDTDAYLYAASSTANNLKTEKTVTDNGYVARGVCTADEKGNLLYIQERTHIEVQGDAIRFTEDGENWTELAPDTIVSMNMWGFVPSFLKELESKFAAFMKTLAVSNPEKAEFFLPFAVDELLHEGKATAKVLRSADKWYGGTYAADKPQVVAALRAMADEGKYPDGLWGN